MVSVEEPGLLLEAPTHVLDVKLGKILVLVSAFGGVVPPTRSQVLANRIPVIQLQVAADLSHEQPQYPAQALEFRVATALRLLEPDLEGFMDARA